MSFFGRKVSKYGFIYAVQAMGFILFKGCLKRIHAISWKDIMLKYCMTTYTAKIPKQFRFLSAHMKACAERTDTPWEIDCKEILLFKSLKYL